MPKSIHGIHITIGASFILTIILGGLFIYSHKYFVHELAATVFGFLTYVGGLVCVMSIVVFQEETKNRSG